MARRYAPILCSIWDDKDFQQLSPAAQRLYVLLLSQKKLNMVGVIPLALRNWSRGCAHTEPADIDEALGELTTARFVIVDHDTDEVLVRTVLKHDAPKGPKSRIAMWRALSTVESETLRRAVAEYITVDIWEDEQAQPPDDLKYLRNAPSDAPPDPPSDGGADGARERARAYQPSTGLPSNLPPREESSSVSTVVGDAGRSDDDDDFAEALELIVDAKVTEQCRRKRIDNPNGYRITTRTNTIAENGDVIRTLLAEGNEPKAVALLVLGHGIGTEPEARAGIPWCGPDCPDCEGDAWVDTGNGLAPCPNRRTA